MYHISWPFIQYLLRYLSLDQSGGPKDQLCHPLSSTVLTWLKSHDEIQECPEFKTVSDRCKSNLSKSVYKSRRKNITTPTSGYKMTLKKINKSKNILLKCRALNLFYLGIKVWHHEHNGTMKAWDTDCKAGTESQTSFHSDVTCSSNMR